MNCKRFVDQHVVITGGSTGIGRAIAHRFAAEGAAVTIAGRTEATGRKVAGEIEAVGGRALFVRTDVGEPADIESLVRKATERFGPFHVAVANAAVTETTASAMDISWEEWDQVYRINARGAFLFCQASAKAMIESEIKGAIVTIGSLMARSAKGIAGAYPSSKAALIMFTKNLAKCLAPMGIRVNCVSPGIVKTDIYRAVEQASMMEPGDFAAWLVEESTKSGQLLLGREGTPEEIAAAVAFLASSEASYITAQNLSVDGGIDWCW